MLSGQLSLIPVPIAEYQDSSEVIPTGVSQALLESKILFIEHPKTIRRLIKSLDPKADIESYRWVEVGKRIDDEEVEEALMQVVQGKPAALLSEAGMPCIGDPGYRIVHEAHNMGIKVVPYPGPNAFLMALMASGFNGQSFSFHGYVPLKNPLRSKKISDWENKANQSGSPQIFMETPYRNNQLLKDLLGICNNQTQLSISCDIMGDKEKVTTASIKEWKAMKMEMPKLPAVFILGKRK